MKVLLFARARDLAGSAEVDIEVRAGGRVTDVRRALAERYPKLAGFLPRCAVAVNEELAGDDSVVSGEDRIALLPPVSGG